MSRWLVGLLLAMLSACAAPPPTVGASEPGQVRTESDQTSADKRARVRLELASLYLGRGQTNTALDEVKLALAAKPDMPEAYNMRGLVYGAMGEARLAEESFQRALQLNPRDSDAMHNLGWFYCQQRRYPEADTQFGAALAQPQYRDGARTLLAQGVCEARAGRWPDAERSLQRSFELDPTNPNTAFNLSDVLYRRGEFDRARFYIKRVNAVPEQSNAQTLWLATRIERRAGNRQALQEFTRQLRDRFPQSPEAALLDQGRFDD
jgi:type IV pilus assembly protein PilF